jgi:hypothetical protein
MKIDFRKSDSDPEYEKIIGLRKSRSINYKSNWIIFIGVITLPIGVGVVILIIGIFMKIKGKHLKVKYKE